MPPIALDSLISALQTGGPYAIAAIAAWWGWSKDRANTKQTREFFYELVKLHETQTSAVVRVEATLASLRDLISVLSRNRGRG